MLATEISVASSGNDHEYPWTNDKEEQLRELFVSQSGNWKSISVALDGPSPIQCRRRWHKINPDSQPARQHWSPEEDAQLRELVQLYGKKWSKICTVMNWRTGKQVRERYLNQLEGAINQEKWTDEEDKIILKLYKKFGTKWSYISSFLNGRPENMVKNRFYANLKRRYQADLEDSYDEDSSDSEENKIKKKKKVRPLFTKVQPNQDCCKRITRSKKPQEPKLEDVGNNPSKSNSQHQFATSQQQFNVKIKEENNDNSISQQKVVPQLQYPLNCYALYFQPLNKPEDELKYWNQYISQYNSHMMQFYMQPTH